MKLSSHTAIAFTTPRSTTLVIGIWSWLPNIYNNTSFLLYISVLFAITPKLCKFFQYRIDITVYFYWCNYKFKLIVYCYVDG